MEGIRACALKSVSQDRIESLSDSLSDHGLTILRLEKIAAGTSYANSRREPSEGEAYDFWCAIGRLTDLRLLEAAHASHDVDTQGRLLGYPSCCTDFFQRAWVDAGFVDTTWPMAQNTPRKRAITATHLEIPEASRCNVLLRWLGPRAVFHLPCSFDCHPTAVLADIFADLARSADFHQEMEWLREILEWPVAWSALNGLAEITTPVGTIWAVTDTTAERYRVTYRGTDSEKAKDRAAAPLGDTSTQSVDTLEAREPEHVTQLSCESFFREEWYHADNGFSSRQDMDVCHQPIVKLAKEILARGDGAVLDLGCGNGVLLKSICDVNNNLVPWGVDVSSVAIAHARMLMPHYTENFVVSDIFDECLVWAEDRAFELVILMLGRLTEVPGERSEALVRRIRGQAKNLLVYAYDDYAAVYGSLEELARRAGVTLSARGTDPNVGMARLDPW